jgi:hypothetical protein
MFNFGTTGEVDLDLFGLLGESFLFSLISIACSNRLSPKEGVLLSDVFEGALPSDVSLAAPLTCPTPD